MFIGLRNITHIGTIACLTLNVNRESFQKIPICNSEVQVAQFLSVAKLRRTLRIVTLVLLGGEVFEVVIVLNNCDEKIRIRGILE